MTLGPPAQLGNLDNLAVAGLQQLRDVVAVVRQIFAELGYGESTDAARRQAAFHQQYAQAMLVLRRTAAECNSLAAHVSNEGRPEGHATSVEAQRGSAESFAARIAQTQAELCMKNEVLKQLIDQIRQMLESICMWESHRHQLERLKLAEGH
ncbi:hypothetical protein PLESTM_002070900 [Pleodorina starrii]|nr:hypothetical protein PLESTM_002070900 [Pleodorina starrii]